MESKISGQKAFHTALIISPPQDQWEQIQNIRKQYDSAYDRWMPHINMSFPFLHDADFDAGFNMLQNEFKDVEPFQISFKNYNNFNHGKKSVLWLQPYTDGNQIQDIETRIQKVFPFLDDLVKKGEGNGFTPHLTVGHFASSQIDTFQKNFQKELKPIQFLCNELYMIKRDGKDTPFYIVKKIKLGKGQ